jgi:hypothetical protein
LAHPQLPAASMHNIAQHLLGTTDEVVAISTMQHHREAVERMVRQSRHTVEIASRELDPAVFDTPELVDALTNLVLVNRRARVRVLVWDPQTIVRRGHRLLGLAANLSTFFEIRRAGYEHRDFNGALVIADAVGYVQRLSAERYEGTLNFNDRRQAKLLRQEFDGMWSKSTPDSNLRRMVL